MEENKLKFNLQFFADQSDDPDEPGGDGKKEILIRKNMTKVLK